RRRPGDDRGRHERIRIRIGGSRIEVPDPVHDPPPAEAAGMHAMVPLAAAPPGQVPVVEPADVAVPPALHLVPAPLLLPAAVPPPAAMPLLREPPAPPAGGEGRRERNRDGHPPDPGLHPRRHPRPPSLAFHATGPT